MGSASSENSANSATTFTRFLLWDMRNLNTIRQLSKFPMISNQKKPNKYINLIRNMLMFLSLTNSFLISFLTSLHSSMREQAHISVMWSLCRQCLGHWKLCKDLSIFRTSNQSIWLWFQDWLRFFQRYVIFQVLSNKKYRNSLFLILVTWSINIHNWKHGKMIS